MNLILPPIRSLETLVQIGVRALCMAGPFGLPFLVHPTLVIQRKDSFWKLKDYPNFFIQVINGKII